MDQLLPVEVACIKKLAEHEARFGPMTERERMAFRSGFVDGSLYGLERTKAVVKEAGL